MKAKYFLVFASYFVLFKMSVYLDLKSSYALFFFPNRTVKVKQCSLPELLFLSSLQLLSPESLARAVIPLDASLMPNVWDHRLWGLLIQCTMQIAINSACPSIPAIFLLTTKILAIVWLTPLVQNLTVCAQIASQVVCAQLAPKHFIIVTRGGLLRHRKTRDLLENNTRF